MEIKDTKKIILNCGVSGCCPRLEIDMKDIFIKDDYGNRVRMKKREWELLVKEYQRRKIK